MKPMIITAGDPGGIGYEIVLKALPVLKKEGLLPHCRILANKGALKYYSEQLNLPMDLAEDKIVPIGSDSYSPIVGRDTAENGKIALDTLAKAVDLIKAEESKILVTAPISKKSIVMTGQEGFTGHTSYLGRAFGVEKYTMVLANPDFAVALVTIHHAISKVPSLVSPDSIEWAVENFSDFAKKQGDDEKSIWICGLNPHAGEDGELGQEEIDIITPTVCKLKKAGYPVKGPFPADALFKKAMQGEKYFLAMYHDQGLIPVKMLGGNKTVNISLGLPFFRISVEHGTAYDIAGKNKADITSFMSAIKIAGKMG